MKYDRIAAISMVDIIDVGAVELHASNATGADSESRGHERAAISNRLLFTFYRAR